MRSFDWDALRSMWVDHADRAVAAMSARHPDETFYVLVFLLSEDLYGPNLAMQSFEGARITSEDRVGDLYDAAWSPFEWGQREILEIPGAGPENVRMYGALGRYAKDGSHRHWLAAHTRHDEVILDAARIVQGRARRREGAFATLKMGDDFVVFARDLDVRYPFLKARLTIEAPVAQRFFGKEIEAAQQREAIDAMPLVERIPYLVSRLGVTGGLVPSEVAHQRLVAIGAPAVDALRALLDRPAPRAPGGSSLRRNAASVLAAMGDAARDAGDALLAIARSKDDAADGAARALGTQGRFEDLVALAATEGARAATGLAAGRPRSYPALIALLDRADPALSVAIEAALQAGRARPSTTREGFAALEAHLDAPHVCIRRDVAIGLRDPDLDPDLVPRAVAHLIAMCGDRNADVRRLAALGLGRFRADARPAIPRLVELTSDRVKAVKETAAQALEEIRPPA